MSKFHDSWSDPALASEMPRKIVYIYIYSVYIYIYLDICTPTGHPFHVTMWRVAATHRAPFSKLLYHLASQNKHIQTYTSIYSYCEQFVSIQVDLSTELLISWMSYHVRWCHIMLSCHKVLCGSMTRLVHCSPSQRTADNSEEKLYAQRFSTYAGCWKEFSALLWLPPSNLKYTCRPQETQNMFPLWHNPQRLHVLYTCVHSLKHKNILLTWIKVNQHFRPGCSKSSASKNQGLLLQALENESRPGFG